MRNAPGTLLLAACAVLLFAHSAFAQTASVGEPGRADKPSKKPNPLKNVYFGEQHIHTRSSPDAFELGQGKLLAWYRR